MFFFAFSQFFELNRNLPRANEEELVPGELVACVVNNDLVAVGTVRFVGGNTKLVDGHQDGTHGDVFVQDASRQRQTKKNITRSVKTPPQNTSQSTLSKHIINTHDQHIFSKQLLKTASQNTFSKHLLKTLSQNTFSNTFSNTNNCMCQCVMASGVVCVSVCTHARACVTIPQSHSP